MLRHPFVYATCFLSLSVGAPTEQSGSRAASSPPALAEGRNGVIVGTTGPKAVHAGLDVLKKGGSAADAAIATALAQIVECGGSYVSHAGILCMKYYEAKSGKVHYLDAGFNTVRGEKEPQSIPGAGKPSGRSALVPGFMAGVQAAHDRFGKMSRQDVFKHAIDMAERGVRVSPLLARLVQARKAVLSRLPETKRIFTKGGDTFYQEGDDFRQPELARTLRHVAEQGASFMYTGEWAEQFVAAIRKEGGKITMEDLNSYRVTWQDPVVVPFRKYQVFLPSISSQGGVTLAESLNLLERANMPKLGHYENTAESLFWLMQISHCQVLGFLPSGLLKHFDGLDLTPQSRITKQTAGVIWQRMQKGKWPFVAAVRRPGDAAPSHSDGIVVADRWGNVAAVTHSINTILWGDTALFVGGVSIPDSAATQQNAIHSTGPGNRLPNAMCPLIALQNDKPVLASSAIGGGLHQKTLQVLTSVLDFGMDPQAAVEVPAFLLPALAVSPPTAQVERGKFDGKLLDRVRALGQAVNEVSAEAAAEYRGYWVGVQIRDDNLRRGMGTRQAPIPSVAEGY